MKIILVALIFLFAHTAWSAGPTRPTAASNRAGLELMNQVAFLEKDQRNILLSPVSYYLTLAMSYNGTANGTPDHTRARITEWLGIASSMPAFNQGNKLLQTSLIAPQAVPKALTVPLPPILGIYNSAWANTAASASGGSFAFKKEFVTVLQQSYNADVTTLDFKEESAAPAINTWVAGKTNGLITQIVDPQVLAPLFWMLLDTTTLQAQWQDPFTLVTDPSVKRFAGLSGFARPVSKIERTGAFRVFQTNDFTAVEIPFYGSDQALIVVLPQTSQLFSGLQDRTIWRSEFWNELLGNLDHAANQRARVVLPRFSFSYTVKIQDQEALTQTLGLQFLFDDSADFSALSAPGSLPSKVGVILQTAKITLDENGLSAAGATVVGGLEATSVSDEPVTLINADKPFFFAVASKKTGVLLFTGSVVDPQN